MLEFFNALLEGRVCVQVEGTHSETKDGPLTVYHRDNRKFRIVVEDE